MAKGADRLNYNLYTNSSHTIVWGDGTGVTVTVSGNAATASHTVYGRIAGSQNAARLGAYTDSITVTVTF